MPEGQLGYEEQDTESVALPEETEEESAELPTHTEDGREILYDDPEFPNGYFLADEGEEETEVTPPAPAPTPRTQPVPTPPTPVAQARQNFMAPTAFSAEQYVKDYKAELDDLWSTDPTAHAHKIAQLSQQEVSADRAISEYRMNSVQNNFPELIPEFGPQMRAAVDRLPQKDRLDPSADLYAVQFAEGNEILRLTQSGMSAKEAKIKVLEKSLSLLKGKSATPAKPVAPAPRQPNPNAPRVPSGGGVSNYARAQTGAQPRGSNDATIRGYMEAYGMTYEEAKALRTNWGNHH
jgi:hypothetical protein